MKEAVAIKRGANDAPPPANLFGLLFDFSNLCDKIPNWPQVTLQQLKDKVMLARSLNQTPKSV
jgi:hypothetical protein